MEGETTATVERKVLVYSKTNFSCLDFELSLISDTLDKLLSLAIIGALSRTNWMISARVGR